MEITDLHWAAGFLEGEGSFTLCPGLAVSASQVQRFPLDRLAGLFGGRVSKVSTRPIHHWVLTGRKGADLMRVLYPLMSPRRQSQIAVALLDWMQKPVAHADQTHCVHGHPFDEQNTYRYKGRHRQCRACNADRSRRYAQMAKSA